MDLRGKRFWCGVDYHTCRVENARYKDDHLHPSGSVPTSARILLAQRGDTPVFARNILARPEGKRVPRSKAYVSCSPALEGRVGAQLLRPKHWSSRNRTEEITPTDVCCLKTFAFTLARQRNECILIRQIGFAALVEHLLQTTAVFSLRHRAHASTKPLQGLLPSWRQAGFDCRRAFPRSTRFADALNARRRGGWRARYPTKSSCWKTSSTADLFGESPAAMAIRFFWARRGEDLGIQVPVQSPDFYDTA